MQEFYAAYYVVRGIPFAVVLVNAAALSSERSREEARSTFRRFFPQVPIVLAVQQRDESFNLNGEKELIGFLSRDPNQIHWQRYTSD